MIKYFRRKAGCAPKYLRCSLTDSIIVKAYGIIQFLGCIEQYTLHIAKQEIEKDYTELNFAQLPLAVREIWKDDLIDSEDEYEGKYLV